MLHFLKNRINILKTTARLKQVLHERGRRVFNRKGDNMKRRDFVKVCASAAAFAPRACPATVSAQDKVGLEGLGRPSARLSDGRGDSADGQEAREGDQRPYHDPDVPVDAARRREGDDRAGTGRRAADRAHLGRRDGPGGRRAQRLQPAVRFPGRSAHAQGDRRPDRAGAAREASPPARSRGWSCSAGWTPARATSTRTSP